MYCLNMLAIALELARENPAYDNVASNSLNICPHRATMNNRGPEASNSGMITTVLLRRSAPPERRSPPPQGAFSRG